MVKLRRMPGGEIAAAEIGFRRESGLLPHIT